MSTNDWSDNLLQCCSSGSRYLTRGSFRFWYDLEVGLTLEYDLEIMVCKLYHLCCTVNEGSFPLDKKLNTSGFFKIFLSLETEVHVRWKISDSRQKSTVETYLLLQQLHTYSLWRAQTQKLQSRYLSKTGYWSNFCSKASVYTFTHCKMHCHEKYKELEKRPCKTLCVQNCIV